jgi:hypothetical protein
VVAHHQGRQHQGGLIAAPQRGRGKRSGLGSPHPAAAADDLSAGGFGLFPGN